MKCLLSNHKGNELEINNGNKTGDRKCFLREQGSKNKSQERLQFWMIINMKTSSDMMNHQVDVSFLVIVLRFICQVFLQDMYLGHSTQCDIMI